MKTRSSMLVAVLCLLAYYSCTDGISAFNNLKKDRPSSNIFDPLGLVSASRQGQLVALATRFSFTKAPIKMNVKGADKW